jgi:hypothetical protein
MGMNSKRNTNKVAEEKWASDESLQPLLPLKKSPGRPKKNKPEEKRNVQLRLPVSLLEEIDSLLDGESRHAWMLKAIKSTVIKCNR